MRRMLIIAMLTIAAASFSACNASQEKASSSTSSNAAATPTPNGNVEKEVKQMEQDWVQADLKNDITWYERHLADELVWTNGRLGKVSNKTQLIADAKSSGDVTESQDLEDFQVRALGNTAVATYKLTAKGKEKGVPYTRISFFTNVWVKRDGRWQVAASHSSPIPSTTK